MSATKTHAFVLKTQDYRDTSLLAHFYTRDFGKIHGIIKGIRDARGRYDSTLEPFSLNEILFYRRRRGGDLHQVTQVDLVDSFLEVRQDIERLAYASYFLELVNELTEIEDAHPAIFELIQDSLAFLSSGASPRRAARVFEVKFFDRIGLMPEIRSCVVCRAEFPEPAFFHPALGGIRCRACMDRRARVADGSPGEATAGMPVSRGTLNFLDRARRAPIKELYNIKVSQTVGEELEKTLRRFVDFHLQNKLKTVVFLEKMGYS